MASGVSTDAAGNVYVTGRFSGIATFGATSFNAFGDFDGFLAKYDPQGTVLWAKQFGGTAADLGRDVHVDAAGNVYVVGLFGGTAAFGTQSVTSVGDADAFVARYNAAGVVQWVHSGGSTAADVAYQVATDGAGNVYTVGSFGGLNAASATFDGTTLTGRGGADAFVVSYTAAGVVRWARAGGSTGNEYAIGLGVTSAGVVTIAGPFGAAGAGGTATFGTTTLTSAGGTDGFVVTYTSAGAVQWARRFGGTADDGPNGVAVDAAGNAYLCGYLRGSVTFAGTTVTSTASFNVLVLSFSATGAERWVERGGGDTGDSAYQLTTDAAGDAYVTGFFQGPAVFGNVTLSTITAADVMVVKYAGATGLVQWAVSVTGDDNEFGRGIGVDNSGNIYVAGSSASATITFNATVTLPRVGGLDGFVAKLAAPCGLTVPTVTASGPVCAGQTLTLTATNVPANTTVRWNGPNGFTATTATATVPNATAAASGLYTLTVTSVAQGCSVTASVTATVSAAPTGPTATGLFGRCGPGTLTLSVASAPNATYRWYTTATGGTPIAGATGPTYTTPSLGATTTYYVSATAAGGCESLRTAVVATVSAAPTAALAAGGPTTFCAGGSVTLTATGSAGATYQFLLNGQPVSPTTPTTLAVTQSGTYTVTATAGPACATTSAPVTVTVNPAANASFAYSASTFCFGGSPTITPTISGTAGGTFSVSPATGLNVNPTTGVITLAGSVAGTYAVSYSVGGLCPGASSQTLTLTAAPSATFSYAQPTYCTGTGLTAAPTLAPGAGAGTYSATPAGLAINATTGVINLATSAAGTYTVANTLAATGTCPAALATATVMVEATPAQPVVTATAQGALVLLTSSAATGNQWYLNGTPIAGATSSTYLVTAAAQNGAYTVIASAGTCASAASTAQTITVTGTAADAAAAASLLLYPNPTADGRVTLTLAPAAPNTTLTVLDAAGRAVLTRALPAGTTRLELDAHVLPAGVYAVRVGAAVRRLVRQ